MFILLTYEYFDLIAYTFIKIVRFLLVISEVFKQIWGASLGNLLNLNYVLRRGSKNTQV